MSTELTQATKDLLEQACAAVAKEGFTFCGIAIHDDETAIQPFSSLPTTAEFVYNMISGAGLVAQTIGANVDAIEAAQTDFQKQFIKINEA